MRRSAALLGFFAVAACSGSGSPTTPPPSQPASVDVAADSVAVRQLASATLSATVRDAAGHPVAGAAVTWSSARPEIVSVDAAGTLTTGRPGAAWVTASLGALRDSVRVRVRPVWTRMAVGHRARVACALSTDGSAYCWGSGAPGELGSFATTSQVPLPVDGGHRFGDVAVGFKSACALELDGTPYCWGDGDSGQLGNGREAPILSPRAVPGNLHLASIVAGESFYCGLDAAGALYCWGSNHSGELGVDPLATEVAAPGRFHPTLTFSSVSAGATHSCGIKLNSGPYCWGTDSQGELGDGDRTDWRGPTAVPGFFIVRSIGAAAGWSCGIDNDGAAGCWGTNFGFSPDGRMATSARFASISPGDGLVCGRTAAGEAWCWTPTTFVTRVATSLTFSRLALGGQQACGLTAEGDLYCWGPNPSGALGTGDAADHPTPTRVVDPD